MALNFPEADASVEWEWRWAAIIRFYVISSLAVEASEKYNCVIQIYIEVLNRIVYIIIIAMIVLLVIFPVMMTEIIIK